MRHRRSWTPLVVAGIATWVGAGGCAGRAASLSAPYSQVPVLVGPVRPNPPETARVTAFALDVSPTSSRRGSHVLVRRQGERSSGWLVLNALEVWVQTGFLPTINLLRGEFEAVHQLSDRPVKAEDQWIAEP